MENKEMGKRKFSPNYESIRGFQTPQYICGPSRVSIVKGGKPENMVAKALSLVDAKDKLNPTSKILIKPNFARCPANTPFAKERGAYELTTAFTETGEGDLTHPEVLRGVLKALWDLGFENLTVGEGAGGCETDLAYKALGIYELAQEFKANVVDLNWEDSVKVSVPNRYVLDYIWIPKSILRADLLVSLPAFKAFPDHPTLSLKNMIGALPGKYYGWHKGGAYVRGLDKPIHQHPKFPPRKRFGQEIDLAGEIADICSVDIIGLSIIDGLTVVHGDGRAERVNMIFAGFDPVAVDTVATSTMSLDPQKIVHFDLAAKKGLGTNNLSQIDVRGEPINKVKIRVTVRNRQIVQEIRRR